MRAEPSLRRPSATPRRQSGISPSDRRVCPKCGRLSALIIGNSDTFPIVYLRCDECQNTSIAAA